jgi:HAD superfamily hydrolase (TIGR01458 family)
MTPADACVIDLDGTVYEGGVAVPGAAAAVGELTRAGVPICFATNTTRRPRSSLVTSLGEMGVEVEPAMLHTAPVAAARWLARRGIERVSLLLAEATHEEFGDFAVDEQRPQAVVVGDLGRDWTFDRLNGAFRALLQGAELVAIQKNRFWDNGHGLQLDAGPFVAALEYASDRQAILVGKPSLAFFETAAAVLATPCGRIAVIGDSLENDVAGGQAAGCLGVAVRTGSFRQSQLADGPVRPDAVLDSIADLPRWLGL